MEECWVGKYFAVYYNIVRVRKDAIASKNNERISAIRIKYYALTGEKKKHTKQWNFSDCLRGEFGTVSDFWPRCILVLNLQVWMYRFRFSICILLTAKISSQSYVYFAHQYESSYLKNPTTYNLHSKFHHTIKIYFKIITPAIGNLARNHFGKFG